MKRHEMWRQNYRNKRDLRDADPCDPPNLARTRPAAAELGTSPRWPTHTGPGREDRYHPPVELRRYEGIGVSM